MEHDEQTTIGDYEVPIPGETQDLVAALVARGLTPREIADETPLNVRAIREIIRCRGLKVQKPWRQWTGEDIAMLEMMVAGDIPAREIAAALGRTRNAVRSKMKEGRSARCTTRWSSR